MKEDINPDYQEVYQALEYITARFGFKIQKFQCCETMDLFLERMLEPMGIMYDEISLEEESWKKRSEYMLGFLADGTAVVLCPVVGGYACWNPKTQRKKRVTKGTKLQKYAYPCYRPITGNAYSYHALALYMLRLISPRDYLPIAMASALVALLGLVTPKINYWVLGTLVYEEGAETLLALGAVMYVTVGLVACGFKTIRTVLLSNMRIRITTQMQAAVMARTLQLPYKFFTLASSGRLTKRIGISRTLAEKMVSIVLDTSFQVIFSLVYIPQMARYAPALYLPALLVIALQIVITMIISVSYARNQEEVTGAQLEVSQFLFSTLKGIQKIKGFGVEKQVYRRWQNVYCALLECSLNPPLLVKLNSVITPFLSSFGTVLLISLLIPGGVGQAEYIAFNDSYSYIILASTQLLSVIQSIFLMKPLMDYMQPVLDTKMEQNAEMEYVTQLEGAVEVKNLTFAYGKTERVVLKNISLTIGKGEKLAIVGQSGCGKSTLLKLLMGFEKPQAGDIYYDGKPIGQINKSSLRKRIGSVLQSSRLMPGTIASNIAFASAHLTETALWEAAEQAQIADYIRTLDLGMDTEITQSNVGGFSGGQKQCMLLARAFASKPSVLFLDEATSALDNLTQERVLASVSKMQATVVMVAHRLSTVKDCDRIVVIREGEIVEQGNYKQLMEQNGYFAELVHKQIAESM